MYESSRLLNLEFNHGLMGIEYHQLLSRIKRVERIVNMNTMMEEMNGNKEISGTTEETTYS